MAEGRRGKVGSRETGDRKEEGSRWTVARSRQKGESREAGVGRRETGNEEGKKKKVES